MHSRTQGTGDRPTAAAVMMILIFCLLGPGPVAGLAAGSHKPFIPEMLVRVATDGGPAHVIVVEKATQQLSVYASDAKGQIAKVAQMACSTGKVAGGKEKSGDMKTPEGVYFITQKFTARDLAPLYGIAAYPLDYPHLLDRIAGRNGHGIWLHGTDRPLKARDSNGCIALANQDLARLEHIIRPGRTAVLVCERCDPAPAGADRSAADLDVLLAGWRRAIEVGSYHDYLAFYAPDYLPPIDWWRQWAELRRKTGADGDPLRVVPKQVDVYRHKDVWVVRFDSEVAAGGKSAEIESRKLFVAEHEGRLRIVGDEYLAPAVADRPEPLLAATAKLATVLATLAPEPSPKPKEGPSPTPGASLAPVAAAGGQDKADAGRKEIQAFVDRWLAAWSSKDIAAYGACYAAAFSADGMDRKAFLRYKESLNRKYRFIRIKRGPLTITGDGQRATVDFVQRYASDRFRAVGQKTLKLRRENGLWKIYAEISRPG